MSFAKAAAPLLATMCLTACAHPPIAIPLQLEHAQDVQANNTMLGVACDGHDPTASTHLIGNSLLIVTAHIDTVTPGEIGGGIRPFGVAAVPADFADQALTRPVYVRGAGNAACTGVALRAHLRRDYAYEGRIFLDYVLEVAPEAPTIDQRPAAVTRVSGSFEVTGETGGAETRFFANGHVLAVHVRAEPGAAWRHMMLQRAAEAAARVSYPTYAKPLPDERPGRTLDDVTNPAFASGRPHAVTSAPFGDSR